MQWGPVATTELFERLPRLRFTVQRRPRQQRPLGRGKIHAYAILSTFPPFPRLHLRKEMTTESKHSSLFTNFVYAQAHPHAPFFPYHRRVPLARPCRLLRAANVRPANSPPRARSLVHRLVDQRRSVPPLDQLPPFSPARSLLFGRSCRARFPLCPISRTRNRLSNHGRY